MIGTRGHHPDLQQLDAGVYDISSYSDYIDDYLVSKDFHIDIKPLLIKAIKNIEVVAINSYTKTDLDYKNEDKKYIAIGGNRLSRGFTLEGLTINYFLRKANTADTLMQMGRWFGYRIGYLDCCKLFTTSENIEKFKIANYIDPNYYTSFLKVKQNGVKILAYDCSLNSKEVKVNKPIKHI